MATKIKFPLKMADGSQVRTIEELREHFDLAAILGYYNSGRLSEWLIDRYYEAEAEKIKTLDSSSEEFKKKLCEIFAVPYSESVAADVDLAEIAAKNKRYERLKQFTADDDILKEVDKVAFSQEELDNLLDEGVELVYLCGEKFDIPCSKGGVKYIGVNNPMVNVDKEYDEMGIVFKGLQSVNIIGSSEQSDDECVYCDSKAEKQGDGDVVPMFHLTREMMNGSKIVAKVMENFSEYNSQFRLTIQTINEIHGRGSIVEGAIEKGSVRIGDEVRITRKNGISLQSVVLGIECFRRLLDHAEEGDEVGLLLRDITCKDISKGDVVTKNKMRAPFAD